MGARQSAHTGVARIVSPASGQFDESASEAPVLDDDSRPNGLLEPSGARSRARSMGSVPSGHGGGAVENGRHPIGIPGAQGNGLPSPMDAASPTAASAAPTNSAGLSADGAYGQAAASEASTPEEMNLPLTGRVFHAQSLPVHLLSLPGIKCPVCSKFVLPDEIECHLIMCLTKPRINYNEDVLSSSAGECVICFEDMDSGDSIARLPCLCIYHKSCIDRWFEVNRSCPEHPND